MGLITRYFVNGLLVILPITITVIIVYNVFSWAEKLIGRFLPIQYPGLPLIIMLGFIVVTGWLSSLWLLRRVIGLGEKLLERIPIIKFIYKNVKQLSTVVFESPHMFRQAVLVPFPHGGARALGFLTSEPSRVIADKLPRDNGEDTYVCVFVPMSVNPTTGFNVFVPREEIIPIHISSEDALQYIVSAGAIMPTEVAEEKQ